MASSVASGGWRGKTWALALSGEVTVKCLRTRECYIFFPAFPGMLVCCFVGDEVGNVMIWQARHTKLPTEPVLG
jgi:hypothetical protein